MVRNASWSNCWTIHIMFFLGKKMRKARNYHLLKKNQCGQWTEHFEDVEIGNQGTALRSSPKWNDQDQGNRFEAHSKWLHPIRHRGKGSRINIKINCSSLEIFLRKLIPWIPSTLLCFSLFIRTFLYYSSFLIPIGLWITALFRVRVLQHSLPCDFGRFAIHHC